MTIHISLAPLANSFSFAELCQIYMVYRPWRVPIVSLLVVTVIMIFQILDTSGLVSATSRTASHALLAPWFNGGGFYIHTLPNSLFYLTFAIPIELMLGSINKAALWFLGYQFSVAYSCLANGNAALECQSYLEINPGR